MSEESTGDSTPETTPTESTETTTPNPAEMTPAELKKYKVKVDGEEMEVDEDELLSNYQLKKASDKRFQEAMQARKQSEEFIRLLKQDPAKVLSHPSLGVDVKKWAEDYLITELKRETMTPEQREIEEYKAKLAKYQEQEEAEKKKQLESEREAVVQKYQEDYNKQIMGALETSGLPKTEFTVGRMIHYMSKALQNGYELSAKDVTDLVKKDYQKDTQSLYSQLDAETLISILGEDIAKKIRKHDLDKIKKPQQGNVAVNQNLNKSTASNPEAKQMTKSEWKDYIESLGE